MSKAAQHFGKRLDSFMKSPETQEYIAALEAIHTNRGIFDTQTGRYGGTWGHHKDSP